MVEDMADALVWVLRLVLITGLAWGAWLCIDDALLAARPDKMFGVEHFATFALVVLLLISTLGGILHAG
jgi:hypothetical protein